MYGLPSNIDLSFLRGATLLQICIGENEVILNLDPDVSIMVTSTIELNTETGQVQELDDARASGACLLSLLGSSIISARGDSDGTLVLTWANGQIVKILDTWKEFESYTVRHGESLIVV